MLSPFSVKTGFNSVSQSVNRSIYSRLRLIGSLFNRPTFGRTGIALTIEANTKYFRLIGSKCLLTDVSGVDCYWKWKGECSRKREQLDSRYETISWTCVQIINLNE